MTDDPQPRIEMAFKIPGWEHLDVWVSSEDALKLAQDEFLFGNLYVEPIPGRPPDALVTHRRIAPQAVSAP